MNHDLIEKFREKLDSMNISDFHGLNGPGLTCYLNSVLQVFFMTEDFREAVKRCCSEDSTTIDPHLGRLFSDLQTSVAKTHHITKKLGITNVYEQRDAAEYFEKILCLTTPEAAKTFKGELNHKTTCLKCGETSYSRSFFWILPLTVEDSCRQTYSVEKGLESFFKGEKVCGDNKMFCHRCSEKQDADFGYEITQTPEVLTLLLKRFSFDYKRRCFVKLHCKVDVPQTLHMANCTYDLYALVNHFGNLTGGHYTAQIKSFETQAWYHFNDDSVKNVKQPIFGTSDKSLRSCTAYLLMYRKKNRNPEKTDEGDQRAFCAYSEVEAEERHDEADRREAPVHHHQLKDQSCNGGENMMHFNGDIVKKSHDCTVQKKLPKSSMELEKQLNQRAASVKPHREMMPQTGTGEDGDTYKPRLQTQMSNSAKLQKDATDRKRQQLDTNSNEPVNTRGSPTADYLDCKLEQKHDSQKKRLKATEAVCEPPNISVTKTHTKTIHEQRNRVKPADTKVVKNKTESEEADVRIEGKSNDRRAAGVSEGLVHSDLNTFHVSSSGHSSSSGPHSTGHLQSQIRTNETNDCRNSPNLYRKSNRSKRELEKMQHVETLTVTKREKTSSSSKERNPAESTNKVKIKPWR